MCLSVTLHIVDLWQYYVCCTRSGVTHCTLFMVRFLCHMWQYGLLAHQYTYASPRCRTSQYCRTFIPLSVSLWNDLSIPVFDGVGLLGFKIRANAFFLASCSLTFCLLLFSIYLLSFYGLVFRGWGLRTDGVFIALSQPCITNLF